MPWQYAFKKGLSRPRTVQYKCYNRDSHVEDNWDYGSDPHTNPNPSQGAEQQVVLDEEAGFNQTQSWRSHDRCNVVLLFCH